MDAYHRGDVDEYIATYCADLQASYGSLLKPDSMKDDVENYQKVISINWRGDTAYVEKEYWNLGTPKTSLSRWLQEGGQWKECETHTQIP